MEEGGGWGSGAVRGLYLFTGSNNRKKERSCKLESLLTFYSYRGEGVYKLILWQLHVLV